MEGLREVLSVHGGTWHRCESYRSAVEVDVLAHDAGIDMGGADIAFRAIPIA